MKTFRDLRIWQEAFRLTLEIYRVTATFPSEERFGLTSQLRNAANSVAANIAEAHGRYYFADRVRVLYTARGEAEEVRSHLSVAEALRYLPKPQFEELDRSYEQLLRSISAYIAKIPRRQSK